MAYPLLNKGQKDNLREKAVADTLFLDGCRIGCDLMNLFFVIDEHTDVSDNATARLQADIIMDAIRNPHTPRPEGEWIGGKVAREWVPYLCVERIVIDTDFLRFWLNGIKSATATSQRRFVDTFQLYMDSVVQQAIDRNNSHIRDVESYFEVRRDTIGAKPSFAICEVHMNLPDTVLNHPVIMKLTELCIDMLIIGNDLCSYKIE